MPTEIDPLVLFKQLDRACRIGFLVFTAFFAYFAVRLAFSIDGFDAIFKDMLNNKPLPVVTRIAIACQPMIIAASLILPMLAVIIAAKIRRSDHAIIGISLCSFALLVMSLLMWSGLMEPFNLIIAGLTSGV